MICCKNVVNITFLEIYIKVKEKREINMRGVWYNFFFLSLFSFFSFYQSDRLINSKKKKKKKKKEKEKKSDRLVLPPFYFVCLLFYFGMTQIIVLFLKIKVINLLMFLLYPYLLIFLLIIQFFDKFI